MNNKEFTKKDADELLNIEIMAKQLIERVQTLRTKFVSIEGEIKQKRGPTKRQLEKQQSELRMKHILDKRNEKMFGNHLQNGGRVEILLERFPDKATIIKRIADEIKKQKPRT
jgi:hypothetical protein